MRLHEPKLEEYLHPSGINHKIYVMTKKKLKPVVKWDVTLTFENHEIYVNARTEAEAKKKAFAKLMRKGYNYLVNKKQSYADKV